MMKNKIVILLPAYNEELNITAMVEMWEKHEEFLNKEYGLAMKIVAINDGSKDKTEKICRTLTAQYENFTFINHPHNKGLGEAVKSALLYVVNNCQNCRFACVMDCDNTQDPKYIGSMLKKIGANEAVLNADVVIASRYREGSKVQGLAKYRLFTSQGARYVYSLILQVKNVRDYTCGYRLYTAEIINKCYEKFGDSIIEESGFTCMAELLYKLYIVGARFEEVPFILRYDYKQGKSKMNVIKTAINSLRLAFHLRHIKDK